MKHTPQRTCLSQVHDGLPVVYGTSVQPNRAAYTEIPTVTATPAGLAPTIPPAPSYTQGYAPSAPPAESMEGGPAAKGGGWGV